MASLNRVFLVGNLTRDPEIRYTSGGSAKCTFRLAVNRRYTTAQGENRDETCYVDIDVWGRQAESCNNYLKRGAPALVEGRLRYDEWEDRESGQRRSRLLVHAERVQFLGRPSRDQEYDGGDRPPREDRPPRPQPGAPAATDPAATGPAAADSGSAAPAMPPFEPVEDLDDDIPF